jgi:hypothetical protein
VPPLRLQSSRRSAVCSNRRPSPQFTAGPPRLKGGGGGTLLPPTARARNLSLPRRGSPLLGNLQGPIAGEITVSSALVYVQSSLVSASASRLSGCAIDCDWELVASSRFFCGCHRPPYQSLSLSSLFVATRSQISTPVFHNAHS